MNEKSFEMKNHHTRESINFSFEDGTIIGTFFTFLFNFFILRKETYQLMFVLLTFVFNQGFHFYGGRDLPQKRNQENL